MRKNRSERQWDEYHQIEQIDVEDKFRDAVKTNYIIGHRDPMQEISFARANNETVNKKKDELRSEGHDIIFTLEHCEFVQGVESLILQSVS